MDVKQLRYFSKIAELGNMTRAAEALSIAQPALSQQLANLENDLGVRLLDRGVYGAKLTGPGEYVYAQAKSILRQLDHIKSVLAREAEFPSGRSTVGMPASISRLIGEDLVRHFASSDNVLLEVAEHPSMDLVDLVAVGKIDVAVSMDATVRKGVLITPLFVEQLFAVMTVDMAKGRTCISLEDLAQLPLLISGTHTVARRIEEAFQRDRLRYRVVAEIGGTDMLVRLIASGMGCSVLPLSGIDPDLISSGRLSFLSIQGCSLDRTVSLCESESTPLNNASQLVKEKIMELMRVASEQGSWIGSRPIYEETPDL